MGADSDKSHLATFYLDFESASTVPLLGYLEKYTTAHPSFGFAVRYKPPRSRTPAKRTGLAGYGVELALKNTDYLVVDDRDSLPTQDRKPDPAAPSTEEGFFANELGDDPWAELSTPLTKDELSSEYFPRLRKVSHVQVSEQKRSPS